MTRRMRWCLFAMLAAPLLGSAGCVAELGEAQPVRDGLRSGVVPLALLELAEPDERVAVAAAVLSPGDAVAWAEHGRVRTGRDARFAGQYAAEVGGVAVYGCGSLLGAAAGEGAWEPAAAPAHETLELLEAAAPRLLAWISGCPTQASAGVPVRIAVVADAPVGVAWWPTEQLLLVNPGALAALATHAHGEVAVRTAGQALIGSGGYESCLAELTAECEACAASGGTDCEPLFASGETCTALETVPEGRARYCIWQTLVDEPARTQCVGLTLQPNPMDHCYVQGVVVDRAAALSQAILNYGPGQMCTETFLSCVTGELAPPPPFSPSWATGLERNVSDVDECSGRLELYCASCTDPAGPECQALFAGSTGKTDCFDLRRAENQGRGEWLYCASMALTDGNVACINAAGPCVERFYWEGGITGYNQMLMAMASTLLNRETCEPRFALCRDSGGAPFPDYTDQNDMPPTFDPFASGGGGGTGGGSGKCGG